MALEKRQYYCYDSFGNRYNCNSAWYDWGRWATLVIVLIGIVLLFFFISCISARRRRRRGLQPFYGTGWAGQGPWRHGQPQYNPHYQQQQQPYYPPPQGQTQGQYGGYYAGPPSYYQSSQPTGDSNRGYYGGGGNNQDFEMQPPQRVYQPEQQAPEVGGAKK